MNSSDWLQVVLSLVGFFGGAIISWIFFRAQQTTDFNILRELLTKISHDIGIRDRTLLGRLTSLDKTIDKYDETIQSLTLTMGGVKELTDVSKRLDTLQELNTIKATVENIDDKLSNAVKNIISEIKEQQRELSESLPEKFNQQWQNALPVIEASFRSELKTHVPASKEQDALLEKMLGLVEQAINKTGEYQKINFEQSVSSALQKIETNVKGVVGNVTGEVKNLENKLSDLLLALPSPINQPENEASKATYTDDEQKEYIKRSMEIKKQKDDLLQEIKEAEESGDFDKAQKLRAYLRFKGY